jgi:hypothetical protein
MSPLICVKSVRCYTCAARTANQALGGGASWELRQRHCDAGVDACLISSPLKAPITSFAALAVLAS